MQRRFESDEEGLKQKKQKQKAIKKSKSSTTKSKPSTKRTKTSQNQADSVVSGWAKRRTVESLDVIEDGDFNSPRKEKQKLSFDVGDGNASLLIMRFMV